MTLTLTPTLTLTLTLLEHLREHLTSVRQPYQPLLHVKLTTLPVAFDFDLPCRLLSLRKHEVGALPDPRPLLQAGMSRSIQLHELVTVEDELLRDLSGGLVLLGAVNLGLGLGLGLVLLDVVTPLSLG